MTWVSVIPTVCLSVAPTVDSVSVGVCGVFRPREHLSVFQEVMI